MKLKAFTKLAQQIFIVQQALWK